jgi:hypothetical protein
MATWKWRFSGCSFKRSSHNRVAIKPVRFSNLPADTGPAQRLFQMSRHINAAIAAGDFRNMRKGVSTWINILKQ